MSTAKPEVADAKRDLEKLQTEMNKRTIPTRKPGEEVQARTESGATVTITDGEKSVIELVEKVLKGKRANKPEQTEAAGLIPPLDGVGKAANRMVAAIRAADEAAEEKGEAESNLIRALRKAKRTSFKCEGINLLLSHVGPKNKITVQKPK